ncbi:hypothetical protein [Thermomonas sp.]|uniref:hypothetical protein n=1 Tax=Thermomonas sp. TaxID=1971895 RepID=UPI002637671A|nr:hypothetical protein [Thermomonas sp.]
MSVARSLPIRLFAVCALLLAALLALPAVAAQPVAAVSSPGVLVVTSDRGFLGNAEIRDAFDAFAQGRNAELLYVTDARSEAVLDARLAALRQRGARTVAVLPLVISEQESRWQLVRGWLQARQAQGAALVFSKPYGASYLAVEDLSARLREASAHGQRLLLLGYGAGSVEAGEAMRAELRRMGGSASTLGMDAIDAAVYPERGAPDADALRARFGEAVKAAHGAVVVPVAFAPRADTMMDFSGWFASNVPSDAQLLSSPVADAEALAQWMRRAAAQAQLQGGAMDPARIGVVALTHGADWFWNDAIEQALAPLSSMHRMAFAFSMADPPVVERAVRELERTDAMAIVVVRAFGMTDSFRTDVERMLGLDVESGAMPAAHAGHAMGGMDMGHHGGGATIAAAPRIRSALPMATVGGVDADPLFARALLANARSVSRDPARETIILTAHGQGDDAANQSWLDLLASLAGQMRVIGGDHFRAIRYATWREDWPDKNKAAVAQVRAMVEEAARDGGRALIVPARINGRGAADRYLAGLDFGWGQGFVQTPYFAQWFEKEIGKGLDALRAQVGDAAASGHAQHSH